MDLSPPSCSELSPETVDDLFAALSNQECRHVVQYFQLASDSVADFESLVDYSVEAGDASADRERRAIALHHVALPKLADLDVVEYEVRTDTVEYRGCPVAERLVGLEADLDGDRTTGGDRTEAIVTHLEDALQAESGERKDFHVREALQYLSFGREGASED